MRYLIVQDWDNTHGNHAGMVHMCKLLCEKYPDKYRMFVKECPPELKKRNNPIIRKLFAKYDEIQYRKMFIKNYMSICQEMFSKLKTGDSVFLLEYNWPPTSQYELACFIRNNYEGIKIYALSHLTPTYFKKEKNVANRILAWDKPIDIHLTLGSSLTNYLQSIGIAKERISTGFHYVDNDYYVPTRKSTNNTLTVIALGLLQRDFEMLAEIVRMTPHVEWIICRGKKSDVDLYFPKTSNVHIKGFMQEDELREQMAMADASLNVMEDTVGSNVITTSMAMGLALIVSDVGSIRDYCDESNAIFCSNTENSFINAIKKLSMNKEKVLDMRNNSLKKSKHLNIQYIDEWFNTLNV